MRASKPILTTTLVAFLLPLLFPSAISAEPKTAVADNGREVILKDNGEWEYVTDDIYATMPDGQRIKLSPDQRWQTVSDQEAPVYEPVPIATMRRDSVQLTDTNTNLRLDTVVIENQRETVGKNKRLKSNLVFYLEADGIDPSIPPNAISIVDSRGRTYPVFSIAPGTSVSGRQSRLVIRAKGAPRWWGVKFFSLSIEPDTVGNERVIELRKPMSDVLRKEVSKLPEDNL